MQTSDWITIAVTIASFTFGSGIVIAKMSTVEKELKRLKKDVRKTLKKLGGHKYKMKDHEERIRALESR